MSIEKYKKIGKLEVLLSLIFCVVLFVYAFRVSQLYSIDNNITVLATIQIRVVGEATFELIATVDIILIIIAAIVRNKKGILYGLTSIVFMAVSVITAFFSLVTLDVETDTVLKLLAFLIILVYIILFIIKVISMINRKKTILMSN